MVRAVLQFILTLVLAAVCVYALSLSGGDIPLLTLLVPALWILPQSGISGMFLLLSLGMYGLTLPHQPISLSLSVWIIIPVIMVAFSSESRLFIKILLGLCVLSMESGIMLAQSNGALGGSMMATVIQVCAVGLTWYAIVNWKATPVHSWWSLLLLLPMWIAGWEQAALVSLCVTGIMAAIESLKKLAAFHWRRLLAWSLPTVGFAAQFLSPNPDIPSQVLVAWLFILSTAWATDYVLHLEPDE